MDMMRACGAMAFASRLRRLSDRLKVEATRLYRANGIEFNDSWFLLALVLSNRDTVSVTEAADAFGVSHPAISQMAAAMKRRGLLTTHVDEEDQRRTLLRLTEEGRSTVAVLQPLWIAIGECTDELIASTGKDLLAAISEIEEQLEQKNLFHRVAEHAREHAPPAAVPRKGG